jgi:uncharacterized membrane protein YjjB (DUF3815 family)
VTIIGLLLEDALWSALAGLGFALLFNVPRHTLPGVILVSALGHASRRLLTELGISIEFASLIGALAVGLAAVLCARYWNVPAYIFAITGAIPMIPGVFAYRTMIGLLSVTSAEGETARLVLVEACINAIRTGMILAALALGTAFPTLLLRRPRPVV